MGLGDEAGNLRLSIPEHNAGAASFASENGARFEEVPVTTLDDFSQENELEGVRLIKIDVEGFEAKVFAGGKEFLTTLKPDVILFEENSRNEGVPESISIIQSCGYDVFSIPKSWFSVRLQPYKPGADAHDFVAIQKSVDAKVRRKLGL